MEYNTQREGLLLREYGRNVQQMAQHLTTLEDEKQRNSYAATLVELMKSINPNVKDAQEYDQKVWDDLYIISGFKLEAEGPYPKPEPSVLEKRPQPMDYQSNKIKFKHYGRSLEKLISQAMELEDKDEIKGAVVTIGKLMKTFYQAWNREQLSDEVIVSQIESMSNKKLTIDLAEVQEYRLFDPLKGENSRPNRNRQNQGGNNNNNKGRRNNQRRRR